MWAKYFEGWEDGYKAVQVPGGSQDFHLELDSWEHIRVNLKLPTG